ncbi:nucleotidyltransferase domain-containing protein [Methylobacterium sp. R2-1]|uniref:nucleotidyltransferase domain-containing protein n=1 Tax=Methylobacterium sp. R2-1 TaxID=2587064 RepID=UPI001845D560|nr:nucleotidyltransferase domain-containing protein [Methylobacterium sp. R2-1]MBB2961310.1 putative nucleotidyltransferase [Methylobacterium sp. R2-1]
MRTISASEKLVNREALDAAELFLKRLDGRYPVRGGILFGSRARASHNADSDADLAVVLAGTSGDRRSASRDMAGIAFDVLMETGVLVDPLPLWEDELERRAGSRSATRRSSTRSGVMECVCERYARRSLVLHVEG